MNIVRDWVLLGGAIGAAVIFAGANPPAKLLSRRIVGVCWPSID